MTAFGHLLRDWRNRRRYSQLELSLVVGASARHISFLEGGRARPSRQMVLRLAESLEMPRPAANTALVAAGFAPHFPALARDDPRLSAVRDALRLLLRNHAPLPAVVFDHQWDVFDLNDPAKLIFGGMGLAAGGNAIDAICELPPDGPITNWHEVVDQLLLRLRTELAQAGTDERLESRLQSLTERRNQQSAGSATTSHDETSGEPTAVIPVRLRIGTAELALFSMLAQFGSVQEISMADLRVELFFAENDATQRFFEEAASVS